MYYIVQNLIEADFEAITNSEFAQWKWTKILNEKFKVIQILWNVLENENGFLLNKVKISFHLGLTFIVKLNYT